MAVTENTSLNELNEKQVHKLYGNRLRVRVCGLCRQGNALLMVNHQFVRPGPFWAPPGGGIAFGEPAANALAREFLEETHVRVRVDDFLFACEVVRAPLHAVELFFGVTFLEGQAKTGADPETPGLRVIEQVQWMPFNEIKALPPEQIHGVFGFCPDPARILNLRGYFTLPTL
jgi:ADP-ribose pyrophosphatase YjhB (NUDIX family)